MYDGKAAGGCVMSGFSRRSTMWLALLCASLAHAQVPDTSLWVPNGTVSAAVRIGGTLYVAGEFSRVGPNTGCAIPFDPLTGQPKLPFARVPGTVFAVQPDGAGGWFVGGSFSGVAGTSRRNLVHLLADGSVSPWAPDPDSEVTALALSGSTLYVGGRFEHMGGAPRYKLGSVDVVSGLATSFAPVPATGIVGTWPWIRSLAIGPGVVYAGGEFTSINGLSRTRLAALDPATGAPTSWDPHPDGPVLAILPGASSVVVGGQFGHIGGLIRPGVAEILVADASATPWNPAPSLASVRCLAQDGNTLYVGGDFTTIAGSAHVGVAAFARDTGALTAFDAGVAGGYEIGGPGVYSLAVSSGRLYLAGRFAQLGGQARNNLGAVDPISGSAIAWGPNINHAANAVAVNSGEVFSGGWFSSVGEVARSNIAALDLSTGKPLDHWAPVADGPVYAMVSDGTSLWIGGFFTAVNGLSREHLAKIDVATAVVASWNPGAPSVVSCLARTPTRIYAGGYFPGVQVADPNSGLVTPFDPSMSGSAANKIVVDASAGCINVAGGTNAWRFRETDASTVWSVATDGADYAITQVGSTVYLGGSFFHVDLVPRDNLAAFDAATGALLPWAPGPNKLVADLETDGSVIYAGGYFTDIGGQARTGAAALDAGTGAVLGLDLKLDDVNFKLIPLDADVVVSGLFQSTRGFATPSFARVPGVLPLGVGGGPQGPRLQLTAAPVPSRSVTRISWALPAPAGVDLDVFDLQGRLVASPLRASEQPAGPGGVSLITEGWRPGVYLVRARAGNSGAERRIVVVP